MPVNSETIKYVLIGCGRIAPNHIAAALANKSEGLSLAAVCDLDTKKAGALLSRFNLCGTGINIYADYKTMLEKERPQLAAVATGSGEHAKIALDVINAGCSVIVEKPIALSLADADKLIAAAKQKGVKLCTCHQNRFNKSVRKINEALREGRFGKLLHAAAHVRWNRGRDYYDKAEWRGTWAGDGGALMNQCIHSIDLMRWMMGEPLEVMAYTDRLVHPYIEAEDIGLAIIKFKNGAYGIIEGTTNVYPKNLEETLYLFGEKGTVKAGGKSDNRIEVWDFADKRDESDEIIRHFQEDPPNIYGFGHTPLYKDMIEAVREGREPFITGEAGRAALELVLAVYKSAQKGGPCQFPLGACSTTEFAERFSPAVR